MPLGLRRYQQERDTHFVTFSCYQRRPLLNSDDARVAFLATLEELRVRHVFSIFGYVLMPEHVHMLVSEPETWSLASTLRVLKVETSKLLKGTEIQFWQKRYHDFNVFTPHKRVEKLRYMHRNPVARGLVTSMGDWQWSSYQHYASRESLPVEIDSEWTRWLKRQPAKDGRPGAWSWE